MSKAITNRKNTGAIFKPSLLSLAVALGGGFSAAALAQQNTESQPSAAIEEVEVVGFRRSLLNAIEQKRLADSIVEAISADDIGGLPDSSIADALARLPGIAMTRTGGQASGLNIRGLGGDFVHTTLNGREQVTTGGSRAIEFDQYPSELISEAAVYKTPTAKLMEGGVAGTVELRTANPLDNEQEHTFKLSGRGMINDRSDDIDDADTMGYRFTASYQGKFADDTLGVAVGYARLFQPNASSQFIGLQYNGQTTVGGETLGVSEGFEAQVKGGEETRDGFIGAIQWQPNDNWEVQADIFRSTFDSEQTARGYRVKNLQDGSLSNISSANGTAVTGATVTGTGAENFAVFVVQDDDSRYTEVLSGGLNIEWNSGPWTIAGDISYSEADGRFVNGGTRATLYSDVSTATRSGETIDYQLNGLNVGDFSSNQSYADLNTLALTEVGMWPYINRNELNAYQFDVQFEFEDSAIASVEFGMRYSDREFMAQRRQAGYGAEFGVGSGSTELPIRLNSDIASVFSFGGELSGLPDFLQFDFNDAVGLVNQSLAANGEGPFTATANWANNWTMIRSGTVEEKVLASYVQFNIDTEFAGIPVTGNFGVRRVDSEQYSTGLLQVGNGLGTPITDEQGVSNSDYLVSRVGQEYTDYLPSVNLNFHLTENDQLRFAAAKVMSRPPIERLQSGGGSWISEGAPGTEDQFNVWGNNSPLLDPLYANQIDLSYEHYFEDGGSFVAAIFYKDIESLITDITIDPFDFAAAGIDIPAVNPNTGNPIVGGQFQTAYNNTDAGYIQGLELAVTKTFGDLPGIWSGLGMTASYSYTESEISVETNLAGAGSGAVDITFPGLSENLINATVFFDYKDFSTRLSARYRDEYVGTQVAVETQLAYFDGEVVVDYQASYNFDEHLQFVFQVNNLTDEPNKTYFGNAAQTGTLQWFGREYFLGVNYSF